MDDPKVGRVWELRRFAQEEHKKLEQGAMRAGAAMAGCEAST